VSNSDGIPDDRNLFTTWGGHSSDELDIMGTWGGRVDGPDFIPAYPGPINDKKVLDHVVKDARERARTILQNCHCTCGVNIIYIQIDKKGHVVDPPRAFGGMPAMHNELITQ
jgi:hypothetical protein